MPRILLQNFETGLHLDLVGAWTGSPVFARDFPNCVKATEFKIQHRLSQAFAVVLPESTPDAKAAVPRSRTTSGSEEPVNPIVGWGKPATAQLSGRAGPAKGTRI